MPVLFSICNKSPRLSWSPRALRNAPVYALKKHCQLGCRQIDLTLFCCGPHEPAPLKAFGKQACPLALPPNDLEQIATPTPKHKQMAAERILLQGLFCLRRQCVKTAPHIGHTRSEPNLCVGRHRDHEISPFNSRANSAPSKCPSTDSRCPPLKAISSREGNVVKTGL